MRRNKKGRNGNQEKLNRQVKKQTKVTESLLSAESPI